jgi:hypothetical protein
MAWTDQCKIEAVSQIDHKVESGLSVREALKAVANESEIPQGTLKRWKYPEKSVPKNGNNKKRTVDGKQVFRSGLKRMENALDYVENNHPCCDYCKLMTKLGQAYAIMMKVYMDAKDKGFSDEQFQEMLSELNYSCSERGIDCAIDFIGGVEHE